MADAAVEHQSDRITQVAVGELGPIVGVSSGIPIAIVVAKDDLRCQAMRLAKFKAVRQGALVDITAVIQAVAISGTKTQKGSAKI